MDRKTKHKLKDEMSVLLKQVSGIIVTEYRGMTVEELTLLRVQLRKSGATFKIIKNRVVKKSVEADVKNIVPLSPNFKGPIGLVLSFKDSAQATKAVFEFEKDHPNFIVKAGYVEAGVYAPAQLKAIAALPSKEVLLGQILGTLMNPHRGLVTVLSGVPRNLVNVLNAIKDKKSS